MTMSLPGYDCCRIHSMDRGLRGVGVAEGVAVGVGVAVALAVGVAVRVGVAVGVSVGSGVSVGVAISTGEVAELAFTVDDAAICATTTGVRVERASAFPLQAASTGPAISRMTSKEIRVVFMSDTGLYQKPEGRL
jgi:hypothetical protein